MPDMGVCSWMKVLSKTPIEMALPDTVLASAVLVTITADEAPFVVLTRRSAHLSKHAGQISFPGGRVDSDDLSLEVTALREAEEEVGMRRDSVTTLGYLPDMMTGTGFRITPVVAQSRYKKVDLQARLVPNIQEVDEILYAPLSLVLDVANYDSFVRSDDKQSWRSWRLMHEGHIIWGATAAILHHWAAQL